MKIIFGLGNPGPKYKKNRHNVGYRILDKIAETKKSSFKKKVILTKPAGYMNDCGLSVRQTCRKHKVSFDDILLVYDDADLPLGKIRFRKSGSCGGHRGMASTAHSLETEDIARLKVGIGRDDTMDMADYVLSDFLPAEEELLEQIVKKASLACIDWVEQDMDSVMKKYN